MLKIVINGKEADLGELAGIEMQYNGGIFEFKEIVGTFSIPFDLPKTPRNNLIFGFPYEIGSERGIVELPAEIWHSGLMMASGTLSAESFPENDFSCTVMVDNGFLFNSIKDEKLNEHYLGEDFKDQIVDLEKAAYDVDNDLYVLYPVVNTKFFSNIPNYTSGANYLQNNFVESLGYFDKWSTIITPFPLLWQVLRLLFTGLGFRYVDFFFTRSEMKKINIYSQKNTMRKTLDGDPYVYPLMPDSFNLCEQLPSINIGEFLLTVQNYFNVVFVAKNETIRVFNRNDVLLNRSFVDFENNISGTYSKKTFKKPDGWIFDVKPDLKYHLFTDIPNLTDYKVSSITAYKPTGTTSKAGIVKFWQHYAFVSEASDSDPFSAEWKKVQTYLSDGTTNHDNSYMCASQNAYFDGNRETLIPINCMPLPNWTLIGDDISYNIAPWVELPGNTFNSSVTVETKLRLSIYKGIVDRVYMIQTPTQYVDNCPYSSQGTPTDPYYISAKGSYDFHWKDFIPWYQKAVTEEYEQCLALSVVEVKNFDFTKKYKMYNNLWFVKSFTVQLTRDEILPAKCKMIKANY